MVLIYVFVDASGSGFCGTLLREGNIHYYIGIWSSYEDVSSLNWREFENIVYKVEELDKRDG